MSDFISIKCPEPQIVNCRIQNKEDIYLYLINNCVEFHNAKILSVRFHLTTEELQLIAIYALLLGKEKLIQEQTKKSNTYIFGKHKM